MVNQNKWIIIDTLENGETVVCSNRWQMNLETYTEAYKLIENFMPGSIAWAQEPHTIYVAPIEDYAKREWKGSKPPLKVINRIVIPVTDYDPKKHDTFHLRVAPAIHTKLITTVTDDINRAGLAVNVAYPGSALDVMSKLEEAICYPYKGDIKNIEGLRETLNNAHPVIWARPMIKMCNDAILALHDELTVDIDLLFLNPVLWLYESPQFNPTQGDKAIIPMTTDGHIPLPDERVIDLGLSLIGWLFSLDNQFLHYWLFYVEIVENREWRLEVLGDRLPIGTIPSDLYSQHLLKALRFATSPYLIVNRYKVQRHVLRRAEGRFPVASEGIGVILLRRTQYRYFHNKKESGEEVDWSCQWWVSGHWRNHWYPGSMTHKPMWITPYIKGPPDKPLKDVVRLMVR